MDPGGDWWGHGSGAPPTVTACWTAWGAGIGPDRFWGFSAHEPPTNHAGVGGQVKRTPLTPGIKSLERGGTFAAPPTGLQRTSTPRRRRPVSPASPGQRAKIHGRACIVCAQGPCHPAHVIDRSLGGGDDPLAVVPLCPTHHREYDDGFLSLLEHLEPHHRDELAHAVQTFGLLRTLERVTNQRWAPR